MTPNVLYIEDLIAMAQEAIAKDGGEHPFSPEECAILTDLTVNKKTAWKPLTPRQATRVIAIIRGRIEFYLNRQISAERMQHALDRPMYRYRIKERVYAPKREVRHLGGNVMGVRLPYDRHVILSLQELGEYDLVSGTAQVRMIEHLSMFIISIGPSNLDRFIAFCGRHGFDLDDAAIDYLAYCDAARDAPAQAFLLPETQQIALSIATTGFIGRALEATLGMTKA